MWKIVAFFFAFASVGCLSQYQEGYHLREQKGSVTNKQGVTWAVFQNVSADVYAEPPNYNSYLRVKSFKVEVEERKERNKRLISAVDLMKELHLDPLKPPFFMGVAHKGSFWGIWGEKTSFVFVDASSGQIIRHDCDPKFLQMRNSPVIVDAQTIRRKNDFGVFEFSPNGCKAK